MKIKTKNQLLAFLKEKCGYEGKASVEDVLAFCKSEDIAIDSETVKSLFAKTVTVEIEADAGETVEVSNGSDDEASEPVAKSAKVERLAKANAAAVSTKSTSSNKHKAYNAKAAAGQARFDEADKMEAFNASYRLYCSKLYPQLDNYSQKANDLEIVGKDGTELTNTLGGALFMDSFSNKLAYSTEPFGVAKLVSNIVDTTGGNYVQPRKTGIPAWSYVAQGSAATGSDSTYDDVTLVPKQIVCLIKTNRQLFEQAAINVGDDIANSLLEGYWNTIDDAFTIGDGTSTYGGHMGLASALRSGAYINATGNAFSAVTPADFIGAVGVVENVNLARCGWIMSRQAFAQTALRLSMALSGNKNTDLLNARLITQSDNGLMAGANAELCGYPVFFSQRTPTASGSGKKFAYFGDFFGGSMIGMRKRLEIATSEHAGFSSNQIWTRGLAEIAVNICGDGKAGTYGPIVCLQTT